MRATVITDASFCPKTKAAGWAGWIRQDDAPLLKQSGRLSPCLNSVEAEVKAALNGAWLAHRQGARHILVQSDCMAVIHLLNGATNSARLLNLWAEFLRATTGRPIVLTGRHVKGHGPIKDRRTYVNDWCDKEARRHMLQQRKEVQCFRSR